MPDISIEEAKAKIWQADVTAEIDAVREILRNTNTALTTIPGDDDSIMEGIYKVGVAMEKKWSEMCNRFKEAQSEIERVISIIVKKAGEVMDDADILKGKVER